MLRDVAVREAGSKGLGVFALRAFEPAEFIFRRRHGQVVRNEEVDQLSEEDQRHLCELDWEHSAVLLAPGCYLNHACDPNAIRSGVNVYARRPIAAGDEITIDYRLNAFTGELWPCQCGTRSCTGTVASDFFSLDAGRQADYRPFAPKFIRAEYHQRQKAAR